MTLAPGSRLGPYDIISPIGAGGMGEVYRARDSKLGREVAIKVLPEAMAQDPEGLGRFTREARAIAALNHPHIVTIFSNEEADGIRFMTMELIEGRTLNRMIPVGGLPLTQFFDIAIPLADALDAAHQKNITHRDLKPANVMVSDQGRVKVLDFGLAFATKPEPRAGQSLHEDDQLITQPGRILGTAPYMSPEQVEAGALDHRTDIFSLGVMLYEMVTGARPFRGDSWAAVMGSIMMEHPKPITAARADLPSDLSRLVATCLAKDRDHRLQTAGAVLLELREIRRVHESGETPATADWSSLAKAPRAGELRIAVAPFVWRESGHEAEALAAGLTEDITAGFARFSHLSVVSRPEATGTKRPPSNAADKASPSSARYLVEGHVRIADTVVRIGVRLVDTETSAHLWAETYDRTLGSAGRFALQDDISRRVVATVGDQSGALVRSVGLALKDRPSGELTLSELVLRCFAFQAHDTAPEHALLRAGLERALALEPLHANGWACLAGVYHQERSAGFNALPDTAKRHRRAAERAVEIDPSCQNGWREMAVAHHADRDLTALRMAAERVVSLNPLNTSPVAMVGMLLCYAGDWDRGIEIVRQAMQPNPHHPTWYHFSLSMYHYMRREYQESLTAAKRINMPAFAPAFLQVAVAAGQLGLRDEARAVIQNLERVDPRFLKSEVARRYLTQWAWDEPFLDHLIEGLAKAKTLAEGEAIAISTSPTPALAAEPIRPGLRLGPYEITSRLGSGGMGEVWCAHDSRLDRDVAVKVIPPEIALDPERLRRFELEARAASKLNHPNVLVVYDIGSREGVPYLVFELLVGETLKEIIARGPIAQKTAIDYSRQLARGLAAAHDAGIVHRDLKPANLFVTRDGDLKILDFGLAKAQPTAKPTERTGTIEALTGDGGVMGTPGYMSPEQIRGDRVDWRSDLFAFGVVLYEMLSGRRAFARESGVETLNATLKEAPPDLAVIAPGIDAALAMAVARCLEKRPEDRFQSAKDLGFALETLGLSSGPRTSIRSPPLKWPFAVAALVLVALVAVGITVSRMLRPPLAAVFHQVTSNGHASRSDLSQDGETVAYVIEEGTTKRLMVRDLAGGAAAEIYRSDVRMSTPRWSHSGRNIAMSTPGEVLVLTRFGGAPVRIAAVGVSGISWSPDDRELILSSGYKWFLVASLRSQEVRRVEINGPFVTSAVTDVSSDGDRLLLCTTAETHNSSVWSMRTDGADLHELVLETDQITDARWVSDGNSFHYLVRRSSGAEIRRARVRSAGLDLSPTSVQGALGLSSGFSVSGNGKLSYARTTSEANLWRADLNPSLTGSEPVSLRRISTGGYSAMPRWSPDGTRLLFLHRDGEIYQIVRASPDGDDQKVMVSQKDEVDSPAWSPDGESIAYASTDRDRVLLRVWSTRTGTSSTLARAMANTGLLTWAPGVRIAYHNVDLENFTLIDPKTGVEEQLLSQKTFVSSPRYSNGGDRIALRHSANPKGKVDSLAVVSLRDHAVRLLGESRFIPIGWSRDDVFIYAIDEKGQLVGVRSDGAGVRMMGTVPRGAGGHALEIGGKLRLVLSIPDSRSDIWVIDNFDGGRR